MLGFCTPDEYRRFLHQCPIFERLLVEDGIMLVKYWFSVSDEEQERRFRSRLEDPMRSWKLSPIDLESRARWVDFSHAKDEMFVHTDIPEAPWYVVEADDKRRARLNCIAHLLSIIPYEDVIETPIELPPRPGPGEYERPPRSLYHYVPDYAATLLEVAATAAAGQVQVSVETALAALDPDRWELLVADDRRRPMAGTAVDAVIRARRRF